MAGEILYNCKSATHGGAAIAGVTHARIIPETSVKEDALLEQRVITDHRLAVELYGNSPRTLFLLVGAAKADVVIKTTGLAQAAEKHTLKDVMFTEVIAAAELPEIDSGGKLPAAGIRGWCENVPSGTPPVLAAFSTLWAAAADA